MRAAQEVAPCPTNCHSKVFCAWGAWKAWSACSADCGTAFRSHTRVLAVVDLPAGISRSQLYETDAGEGELQERFQQLWRQSKRDEAVRTHELLAAFAAGGLGLLTALVLMRVVAKPTGAANVETLLHDGRPMYEIDIE